MQKGRVASTEEDLQDQPQVQEMINEPVIVIPAAYTAV
jgi:hypothetical protein